MTIVFHDYGSQQAYQCSDKCPNRAREEDAKKRSLIRVWHEDNWAEESSHECYAAYDSGADKPEKRHAVETAAGKEQKNCRAPKGA
ncbi:MAG: hypothetical protein ACOYCD_04600 [Kiritimatiellia bacterium]